MLIINKTHGKPKYRRIHGRGEFTITLHQLLLPSLLFCLFVQHLAFIGRPRYYPGSSPQGHLLIGYCWLLGREDSPPFFSFSYFVQTCDLAQDYGNIDRSHSCRYFFGHMRGPPNANTYNIHNSTFLVHKSESLW